MTLSFDDTYEILLHSDRDALENACSADGYFGEICSLESFWRQKFIQETGLDSKPKEYMDLSWKDLYLSLYDPVIFDISFEIYDSLDEFYNDGPLSRYQELNEEEMNELRSILDESFEILEMKQPEFGRLRLWLTQGDQLTHFLDYREESEYAGSVLLTSGRFVYFQWDFLTDLTPKQVRE